MLLELKDVNVTNARVHTDLMIHQEQQGVVTRQTFWALGWTSRHNLFRFGLRGLVHRADSNAKAWKASCRIAPVL